MYRWLGKMGPQLAQVKPPKLQVKWLARCINGLNVILFIGKVVYWVFLKYLAH